MPQTQAGPDRRSTYRTPRWVKVFAVIAIILILVFIILHLTGNSTGVHGGHPSFSEMKPQ